MASNPSPSSSSDVSQDRKEKLTFKYHSSQIDEDEQEATPVTKKRRYSPTFLRITNPGGSSHDEPSSSHCNEVSEPGDTSAIGGPMVEVARLQARLVERELELAEQRKEAESFLRELQESVECPVCFSIPRAPPVPCCQNGHVICAKCKEKVEVCPTCRVTMTNCVSQVAATIIQKIQHPCDFREAGCEARCDINSIEEHEQSCRFRLVSSRAVTTKDYKIVGYEETTSPESVL